MSRLNDLCDSLDFAAANTMEGHAKMAPGVLKLLGELVREAKRIDKESIHLARRVVALENERAQEDEDKLTLSQGTVGDPATYDEIEELRGDIKEVDKRVDDLAHDVRELQDKRGRD